MGSKELMAILFNDDKLKTLLLIPPDDKNNRMTVTKKYIIPSYGTDVVTTTEKCRIIFRNVPAGTTNNQYCRVNTVLFEIFVEVTNEYIGFDRRQMLIADRLRELLSGKYVGAWKYKAIDEGELFCGTANYRRYFIRFEHKMVYI